MAEAAGGQFSIAGAIAFTSVQSNPTIKYHDGQDVKFEGKAWGPSLGAGVVWLYGALPPIEEFLGDVDFTLEMAPGLTALQFFKNGNVYVLQGLGLNVGAGVGKGSGTVTRA